MTRLSWDMDNKGNMVHMIEDLVYCHFCDDDVKKVVDTYQFMRVVEDDKNIAKSKWGKF